MNLETICLFTLLLIFNFEIVKVVSKDCGKYFYLTPLINNGEVLNRREHPWKVSVHKIISGEWKFICGGVLISQDLVVTAAHCIQDKHQKSPTLSRDLRVTIGGFDFSETLESGRVTIDVKKATMHDSWNPSIVDFDGDIAVIQLAGEVTFNNQVQPICLPDESILSIKNGVVVGWGLFDQSEVVSNVPRKVELPIVSYIECLKRDRGLVNVIWEESFCAGKPGAGVCKGDSGSGFYIEKDDTFYLRGIVSSSTTNRCDGTNYAIYSDVYEYLNFIEKFITERQLEKNGSGSQSENYKPEYDIRNVKCRQDKNKIYGYICSRTRFDIDISNYWITFYATDIQHEEGKSNEDIETLYIKESNFEYLPNFLIEKLREKSPNMKKLVINGSSSKSLLKTANGAPMLEIFTSLHLFDFSDKLSQIPENLLHNMTQLDEFVSNGNDLVSMPENLFKMNRKLSKFDLYKSKTEFLPPNLLKNAPNLKYFKASEVPITEIPENFFDYNTKLVTFYFVKSQLNKLPNNLFKSHPLIDSINIHRNKLKTLPHDLLKTARNLRIFIGNGNQIESIPSGFFDENTKLKNIRLNENRIKVLPPQLLKNLNKLYDISFPNNLIEEIPDNFFDGNPDLEIVLLSGNHLTTLPENLFRNNPLTYRIRLQNNRITHLPPELLKNLTELHDFAADGNQLGKIDDSFFSGNPKIEYKSL